MVALDGDGLRPEPEVAADLTDLLALSDAEADTIVAVLRAGVVQNLTLVPGCADALARARRAGWAPWIVSNGVTAQQERKIRQLGLDALVDGWVISEEAGVSKPDPAIFTLTAARAGQSLEGAWMIGDTADADIAGAQAAGLPCVHLHRGRPWDPALPPPTASAGSLSEAVGLVLARR